MIKSIIALAAAATVIVPAAAQAGTDHRFTRDGSIYVFTEIDTGRTKILNGHIESSGEAFHLIVRDGQVYGEMNGRAVSFRVPRDQASAPTAVASR